MKKKSPLSLVETEDKLSGGDEERKGKYQEQLIGSFQLPYPYEAWSIGICTVIEVPVDVEDELPSTSATPSTLRRSGLKPITHQPLWIRAFGRTMDTKEQLLELVFPDVLANGELKSLWIDRSQIASKNAICALARYGVPVNEGNYLSVMHYLDAALHTNSSKLPIRQVVNRTGYYQIDGEHGFMLGQNWIGPPHLIATADPRGLADCTKAFKPGGSADEWFEAFATIAKIGPVARWLVYCVFAAPLLRHVDERTFFIHHYGKTGTGKTAILKFAMSAFGNPKHLVLHFNRTEKSFAEVFNYMTDVPVAFDELQASKRGSVLQVIYNLVLEQGRGRSQQVGGLASTTSDWSAIIRTTGEEELTGRDREQELGGGTARTIQLNAQALNEDQGRAVHKWLAKGHYGHAGLRFLRNLQELFSEPDGKALLLERFQQVRDTILARAVDAPAVHSRAGQLGVVALAQYLVNRWIFDTEASEAFEEAVSDACHIAKLLAEKEVQQPIAEQALQIFHDHFVGRRHLWFDVTREDEAKVVADNRQKQVVGIVTDDEVWLIQREANMLLKSHDFPARLIWSNFLDEGLLQRPVSSKTTFAVAKRFGSFYAKCYVISRKKNALNNPFVRP